MGSSPAYLPQARVSPLQCRECGHTALFPPFSGVLGGGGTLAKMRHRVHLGPAGPLLTTRPHRACVSTLKQDRPASFREPTMQPLNATAHSTPELGDP